MWTQKVNFWIKVQSNQFQNEFLIQLKYFSWVEHIHKNTFVDGLVVGKVAIVEPPFMFFFYATNVNQQYIN